MNMHSSENEQNEAISSQPVAKPVDRKQRIEELLLMIGGLESSILRAQENKDWKFLDTLKPLKANYYERLRRLSYGLPEESPLQSEKTS